MIQLSLVNKPYTVVIVSFNLSYLVKTLQITVKILIPMFHPPPSFVDIMMSRVSRSSAGALNLHADTLNPEFNPLVGSQSIAAICSAPLAGQL